MCFDYAVNYYVNSSKIIEKDRRVIKNIIVKGISALVTNKQLIRVCLTNSIKDRFAIGSKSRK